MGWCRKQDLPTHGCGLFLPLARTHWPFLAPRACRSHRLRRRRPGWRHLPTLLTRRRGWRQPARRSLQKRARRRKRRGRPQVQRGRLGRAALHLDPRLACRVSAWNGNRCTDHLLPHSRAQRPPPCLASALSALQATSRRAHATWRAGPTSVLPRLTCPTCWCPRTSESGWGGLHGLWASGPGRRALWRDDVRFLRERALAVVPSLPSGCNAPAPSMPTCSAFRPPLQHLPQPGRHHQALQVHRAQAGTSRRWRCWLRRPQQGGAQGGGGGCSQEG